MKTTPYDSYFKKDKIVKKDDFLFSLANSLDLVGRVTYVKDDYQNLTFGAFMGLIRADRAKIHPQFLFSILQSQNAKDYYKSVAKTTTNISNITFEDLGNFTFPLPPLEEQIKIVSEIERYRQIVNSAQTVLANYTPRISCSSTEYKALCDISIFKPSKEEVKCIPDDTSVSFVPMKNLNTFDIAFSVTEERKISDVRTGFTYFRDNDILLAKITPCFENGKAGIARSLKNGIGFGSTEYIVIRANTSLVYPEWIFYHINTPEFIEGGKAFMTGTAGQQRVDINYVKQYRIPVPSLEEQKKILDQISYEQSLIEPSKQLIKVFTKKIETRIKKVWGE